MTYYHRRNDTYPPIKATLKDSTGAAIDLTGCTVRFYAKQQGGVKTINGVCTITSAAGGKVEYAWTSGDVDTAGVFQAEFEITRADSKKQTVPSDEYVDLRIVADLA